MCIDHFPPRQIIEEGKEPTGYSVEIVKAVIQEAGLTLGFTPDTPFTRCLRMLKYGQSDLMAGLIDTPERQEYMVLLPYSSESVKRFFSLKSLKRNIETLDDLKGLSVSTVRGFEYPEEFEQVESSIDVTRVGSVEAAFEMVRLKRIDVVIVSDFRGKHYSQLPRFDDQLKSHPLTLAPPKPVNIGISKKGNAFKYLPQIERAVKKLQKNGTIEALLYSSETI
ncbi:substrate-binding periplasmic protein [Alteromonas ponticola]|uniref:Transporter substrate-binding domain-containing protein n=1 Tax=Alteromonas ponticola TaxID=2720613 RepID=A0ABX1R3Q4_9ALTE|nr:transporter substrate-binding domain-containing protein [Alteromonas ponticola]NMH60413.1 transporter substrate-binding domain-containing protein [Alteromonas ponticola]